MPIGKYKDFADCKAAKKKEGLSEESAKKYCGKLFWKTHGKKGGKKALKKKMEELRAMLNDKQ